MNLDQNNNQNRQKSPRQSTVDGLSKPNKTEAVPPLQKRVPNVPQEKNYEVEDMFAQTDQPEASLEPQQDEPESPQTPSSPSFPSLPSSSTEPKPTPTPPPTFQPQSIQSKNIPQVPKFPAQSAQNTPENKKNLKQFIKKATLGIGILVVLGLIFLYFFVYLFGTIELKVEPSDAKILLSNIDYTDNNNKGPWKIKSGTYELVVKKDGYIEYKKTIKIQPMKVEKISIALTQIPPINTLTKDGFLYLGMSNELDELYGYAFKKNIFYKLKTNQNSPREEPITFDNLKSILDVIWQPSGEVAIIKVDNSQDLSKTPFKSITTKTNTISTWIYDFKRHDLLHQEAKFWSNYIGDLVWYPSGEKVIYYYFDPKTGEKTLKSATKDNQNQTIIIDLSKEKIDDPEISLADDGKFLTLVPKNKDKTKNNIYVLDLYSKNLKKLIENGENTGATISPDGQWIIYAKSTNENKLGQISVIKNDGSYGFDIEGISAIVKIRWLDNENILIAKEKFKESDSLEKFNIKDKKSLLYYFNSNSNIYFFNILFNNDKTKIYFLSENKINRLSLQLNTY